jgi:Tfp pilus assembly major pilin PilA
MYEEEEFQFTYNKLIDLVNTLLEDVDVMMVAAVMSTIGMSLYRTSLSEEDYNKMVNAMFDLKGEVKTFNQSEVLH